MRTRHSKLCRWSGAIRGTSIPREALAARCGFEWAIAFLLLFLAGCTPRAAEPPSAATSPGVKVGSAATGPNVVVIVLDTTRADFLSCYGFDFPTTPHIDAIAAEGIRYTQAFSTAFWTLPSHATLLTGLYPSEAGSNCLTDRLPDDVLTLAERLRDAGYTTSAVVCNPWISRRRGFAQGFSEFLEMWRDENRPTATVPGAPETSTAGHRAAAWVAAHAGDAAPFFLLINFNVPHLPYTPPPGLQRRFSRRLWPRARIAQVRSIGDEWDHLAGKRILDDEDYLIMRDLYAAEIAQVDGWVGLVADSLRSAGVIDDTLLVVTADHGENLGEHGMTGHTMSLYDTTVRVPLVVRYPAMILPGAVDDGLVSLIHVAPMIMEACHIDMTDDERLPARRGLGSQDWHSPTFVLAEAEPMTTRVPWLRSRYPTFDIAPLLQPSRMYRTLRHKLIWRGDAEHMLFDLIRDRAENQDIAADSVVLRDRLVARLQQAMEGIEPRATTGDSVTDDAESLEALRALGYIE